MLEQLDWLVVTLGLTELEAPASGTAPWPRHPGSSFDPNLHELWISSHREAQEDLLPAPDRTPAGDSPSSCC